MEDIRQKLIHDKPETVRNFIWVQTH